MVLIALGFAEVIYCVISHSIRRRRIFLREGTMELRKCKFYCSGYEMNFAVFSDEACRARYLKSIPLPIVQTPVDVYEIEPGLNTHWVLVKQKDGEHSDFKLFIRKGNRFMENGYRHLSKQVRESINNRFPKLRMELGPAWAA